MSQQQVMTNLGPRRKGSARLEPLPFGNGRASQGDASGESVTGLPDSRLPTAHLPPLTTRSKDPAMETFDSVIVDDVSPGVSPARRARKAALMTRTLVDMEHRTVLQASLALDQKEREMMLIRDNKREYGRILLELWVNQVLDSSGGARGAGPIGGTQGLGDPLKMDASALKGLATYGLTRAELLGAGLSNETIDRLYRCMYVYTVGFFDVMQDILCHNEFRTEILSNVWKGFLTIAESALQVSFRSDYLKLYQSQQVAMAELLFAKEQLAEARQDSVNTEQAVAWLTNAHAEERAARQVLKSQVSELQTALERERQAHQAAVTKYVVEVEERVRLQAQLVNATAKLSDAAVAQADVILQRDQLSEQLAAAEQRATRVLEHVRSVYDALALEKALTPNMELVETLGTVINAAAAAAVDLANDASHLPFNAAPTPTMSRPSGGGASISAAPSAEPSDVTLSSNPGYRGSKGVSTLASAVSLSTAVTLASTSALPPPSASASSMVSARGPLAHEVMVAPTGQRTTTTGGGGGGSGGEGAALQSDVLPLIASLPTVLPPLESSARAEVTVMYADLIADLTKQLYGMWRDQTVATSNTARALYEVRDDLRATKIREHVLEVDLEKIRTSSAILAKELEDREQQLASTQGTLRDTEEALQALKRLKEEADQQIEELTRNLEETRSNLAATQVERNTLLTKAVNLHRDVDLRNQRLQRLERQLAVADSSLSEMSRSMVIFAKAAAAQDAARSYCKRQFLDASKRATDLQWSLFRMERQVRTLEGKVEHKTNELSTLAAASDSAKQASEQLQASLAAALLEIESKKAMIGSLERALVVAKDDSDKVKEELENTLQRVEDAELALEEAKDEIQRQADGMQSLESRIAAAGEERQRLLKQVERLVNEKTDLERTFKQQRDSLQAEISRRGTEIASLRADVESLTLQIEALSTDLISTRDLLERKREKKKRWKALSNQYQREGLHLRSSLAEREGLAAELAARLEPLEVDVAVLVADRGRSASDLGDDSDDVISDQSSGYDIISEQNSLEEVVRQSHELSNRLESQQRSVEAARREYETARASFYEAPTEESRKTILLGIEAILAKLRVERAETEADLSRLRDRHIAIQNRIQEHENATFKRRVKALDRRTGKTEVALKNELITRLDEARARILELQTILDQQSGTTTTAQSRAARLEMDYIKTEAEMRDLADKLRKTVEFKVELERQLAQYKNMVGFLQAEVSSLSRERDALKANLQDVDSRVERLTADVSEAQSAIIVSSKRLEAKYDAEKREGLAQALERQKQLEAKVGASDCRIHELEGLYAFANEAFRRFLAAHMAQLELMAPPRFLWHLVRPPHLQEAILACSGKAAPGRGATASTTGMLAVGWEHGGGTAGGGRGGPLPPPSLVGALGKTTYTTNFDWERDSVLGFMGSCWSFDATLVTISQIYVDKLLADTRAEEAVLGGLAGPRHALETIMYEFFITRYGCRQASELHLGTFLAAVRRFRVQHPKVRTFARLIGLPEPPPTTPMLGMMDDDPLTRGPLPPPAVEFYMSLLNRVHARAGPLIAEAAEGFSLVKSKVLSRMAREFLRGSYATTRDDVAATSDGIRAMALNDDEKSIDLELALEAMLRAFVLQYNDDLEALVSLFRHSFEAVGRRLVTLDDLGVFLRQLNAERAGALPASRALALYVEAVRAAGPHSEDLGREICRVLLNSGFVGISTHITRHEPMRALPPYDEFELLEESWRLMRVAVEQQVAVIKSHAEVKCDVVSYIDLARRVDELIGGRESPLPAWTTYRRLLTQYCGLREVVDTILAFDPPISASRRSTRQNRNAGVEDAQTPELGTPRMGGASGSAIGGGGGGSMWGSGVGGSIGGVPAGGGGGDGAGAPEDAHSGDDGSAPGSGAASRDVSPHLQRGRTIRSGVSHKSLGVALSRSNSTGDLAPVEAGGGPGVAAQTGGLRREGKYLLPRGAGMPMAPEIGSSSGIADFTRHFGTSPTRTTSNISSTTAAAGRNPGGPSDAQQPQQAGGGSASVVKLQFKSGGVRPGA